MNTASDRLTRERDFHDRWASAIDINVIDPDVAFEGSTAPENRFILSCMGDIKGKTLLDIGCGAGESSVYFALKGVKCVAYDYSSGMVNAAKRLAENQGVEIMALTGNASELGFPDNTFDIVYAANLLHHVDTEKTLNEIHRVLRPGGIACLWDPLRHNPLINIYRKIARKVRTKDEHPLDIQIVETVRTLFSETEYDTFWLATLWIFLRFYLIERADPNKERYWKKILFEEPRLRDTCRRLEKLDHLIKKIPFMKRFAWNIAIVAKK